MSSLELAQIIIGRNFNPKYPSKVRPAVVKHNTVFMADLKQVELKDLGTDDNGA